MLFAVVLAVVHLSCTGGTDDPADDGGYASDLAGEAGATTADAGSGDTLSDQGPCVPDCGVRECGDDGCGGQCGVCEPPAICEEGVCIGGKPDPVDTWGGWDVATSDAVVQDIFETTLTDTGGGEFTDTTTSSETSGYYDGMVYDSSGWDTWYSDTYGWDSVYYDGYNLSDGYWDAYDWGSWDYANWDYANWDYANWDWGSQDWGSYDWGPLDIQSWDFGPMPDMSGGDCGDIDELGTCEGDILKWCAFGQLVIENCAEYGAGCMCGYDPEMEWYSCMGEGCW